MTGEVSGEPKVTAASEPGVRTRKSKLAGVVTRRDVVACQWVCEQGAMTVEQLWRAVWWSPESNSPRYAYDRVAFLERAGFLTPMRSSYSLKTFFRATKSAQELAGSRGENNGLIPLHSPPITEIGHADGLTELRLAVIRTQPEAIWRADRALAIDPAFPRERFYKHVPDAIWTTTSGKRIAVEYERTSKAASRLRLKVETFSREMARADRVFDLVLWVAVPGTFLQLQTALKTHPTQRLRTLDQFMNELRAQTGKENLS